MSLEKCAVNHKVDKNEIAVNAQAYLKRGLSENEAYIAAANDKIADLKEDERTIVDAIIKAYEAGGFKLDNKSSNVINDLGEKIGGARKDTALKGGTKSASSNKSDDERPTWAKRYAIHQIADVMEDIGGKWTIRDMRDKDSLGQARQLGGRNNFYETKEAAEEALPGLVVGLKHRVYATAKREDGTFGYEIYRSISDRKRVKIVDQVFDDRIKALEYMGEHAEEILDTNTTFGEIDLPTPDNTNRIGVERRTGDVEGKDFMNSFGLRGVEFGNWNNQSERQQVMNAAYDGLLDLADVLNIPAKALGLNGDLALAFGARGQGLSAAKAHYERSKSVINLTKMNGAGSLAHEFFHALDHYFARQGGQSSKEWVVDSDGTRSLKPSKYPTNDFISSGVSTLSQLRPEIIEAYTALMNTMTTKAAIYVEDTVKADNFVGKAKEQLAQNLDKLRKNLSEQRNPIYSKRKNAPASAEQLIEFDTIAEQLLNGEGLDAEYKPNSPNAILSHSRSLQGRRTNDALEKLSAIYKDVRGRAGFDATNNHGVLDYMRQAMSVYSTRLKMLAEAQQGNEKTKQVPTDFRMNARALDEGRSSDYWTTPHEMAARAFQGYVEDKVKEKGGSSPFLNYGRENAGILTPWGVQYPFPRGEERKAINAALDKFVGALKTKETDTGTALFSNVQPTFYSQLSSNGMTAQAVRNAIANDIFKHNIDVYQSMNDAPDYIRVQAKSEGRLGIEGFFDRQTNRVALIASNLTDTQRALEVARHELIGHYGMENMMPKEEFDALVESVLKGLKLGNKTFKEVAAYVDENQPNLQPKRRAREIIAVMAERNLQNSIVKRVLDAVRTFLKKLGFIKSDITDAKVASLLRDAQDYLKQQGRGIVEGSASSFSNRTTGNNSLPNESKESLFRRKAQDYFNRFKDIQDFLKKSGIDLNENEDVYGSEERSYGRKASRIEDFREQTLKPLVEKTIDLGFTMQQVSLVAHAQHAQERNEQIASINEQLPDGGSGMTTTDARAFLSGHAITYNGKPMQMSVTDIAKIQPVVNDLRAIAEQSKNLLLDNGIISQEMADAWDSTYKNYVPLKGGDEAAQTGTGGGYSVNGKQKRALGHGEREENIVENIIRDHEKAIILAENNLVGKHLLNLAIKVSDPSIISIDKPVKRATYVKGQTSYVVSYEGSPIAVYANRQDANAFKREKALTLKRNIADFEISLSTGDPRVQYMATNMLQDNEAIVYVGGKQVKMQINDELMANAYRKLGIEQINGILKVGRDINNFLSKAYTGYNPEFLTTNIQRDFTTGLINVTGKYGIAISKDAVLGYPKAFSDMFMYSMAGKTTKSITAYRASGGGTGAAYLGDIDRIGEDVQKVYDDYVGVIANYKAGENMKAVRVAGDKLVGGLAGWISHLNAAGENAMRLSVFQSVLKKTGSMNEAASAAKNSTVNFNRKGEWGGTLSSLYLFANPNIQGTAIIYDTLIKGEHKGQAWALVGGLVGLKLLSRLQWGDDDDDKKRWNSINQSIRDRNLLIRVGKEKYITIALPYGYNFFGNISDAMMDLKDGVDTQKVAMHLSSSWFENFSPVGNPIPNDKMSEKSLAHLVPFTPLKTGMEFAVNENGLGSPIYPDNRFNENKADYLSMYRSSIGGPYEKISASLHNATGTPGQNNGIDVSPESIKFWWNTIAGGTGRTIVDTASLIKSQTYNRATEDNQDALMPELSEIPMLRKLVRETTVNDVRQQYFQATDDAKKAHDAYKNAQDFRDTKTMNDIKQNEKELLSLAKFADKQNKVISAQKKAIIRILADEKLSNGEKRLKIKEIENRERKIYERGVAIVH